MGASLLQLAAEISIGAAPRMGMRVAIVENYMKALMLIVLQTTLYAKKDLVN
jgi:hypothetical protein